MHRNIICAVRVLVSTICSNFYREIDKAFAFLGVNILPSLIAPKGNRGRQTLFNAFRKYYSDKGYESGSSLVQKRYEINRKYQISASDIEHFELSVCVGLLVNSVPATFWSLYHIYSQASLLAEIREQVSEYVHITAKLSGGLSRQVDISQVIAGCPLLVSLVQETLRMQSTNASGRAVLEDTWIDNQYFLKKDSILLIPSAELHNNAAIWGSTFDQFDPQRFVKKKKEGSKVPASAYRAFGGGASICPGRHFAMNEMVMMVIVMVLKYDISPIDGYWKMPDTRPHITTSILTPKKDICVKIAERMDIEHGDWKFIWGV
jgi:cytochrome P450